MLYLENTLTAHAFTPERIAVLRVLTSQAAISLENARLFKSTKQTEEQLTRAQLYLERAQSLSHTGSFGWNTDTGEVFWSDEAYAIYGLCARHHPDRRARDSPRAPRR